MSVVLKVPQKTTSDSFILQDYKDDFNAINNVLPDGFGKGVGTNSVIEGEYNTASGTDSHAEGSSTKALGSYSHAEGCWTVADGYASHAEGTGSVAYGESSHVEGEGCLSGGYNHAEGLRSISSADGTMINIIAYNNTNHTITLDNLTDVVASGNYFLKGNYSTTYVKSTALNGYVLTLNTSTDLSQYQYLITPTSSQDSAHAEGTNTVAIGVRSHAEGYNTTASGDNSHAEGQETLARGESSNAGGVYSISGSRGDHAEGFSTLSARPIGTVYTASAFDSTNKTITLIESNSLAINDIICVVYGGNGINKLVQTNSVVAINGQVITLAYSMVSTFSSVKYVFKLETYWESGSHAEGNRTVAIGMSAHAEGADSCAIGNNCHAEGGGTLAKADCCHSEGYLTRATGNYSHAEGGSCTASGSYTHAEGYQSTASGYHSHVGGSASSTSSGNSSIAHGEGVTAQGYAQAVFGRYNVIQGNSGTFTSTDNAFIIGNGTSSGARSNAFSVNWSGDVVARKFNGHSLKTNQSTTDQSFTASTRTYIGGTNLQFPAGGLTVGTRFRWMIEVDKTATGTASSTIDIALGTTGTTSDTGRLSFTKPAGTAVGDNGVYFIDVVVRAIGASCILQGVLSFTHGLTSTGFLTTSGACLVSTSSSFDVSTVTNIGVCMTTGASEVVTSRLVTAEAFNI